MTVWNGMRFVVVGGLESNGTSVTVRYLKEEKSDLKRENEMVAAKAEER